MSDDTLLVLTGIGIPGYSARGLTQTLEPIEASVSLRRTVNGSLVDLSFAQFRKYKSTISCQDQEPPAVDGVWPGHVVTVDCVTELSYASGGSPARAVISGSSRTEGAFVFYGPQLQMLVTGFSVNRDEYGAAVQWQMTLKSSDGRPVLLRLGFGDRDCLRPVRSQSRRRGCLWLHGRAFGRRFRGT
jgi:hypothetical protein